jgi:hypothetical protein
MKVLFKYGKAHGTAKAGEERDMYDSTAAVLHRLGIGKITKKVKTLLDKGGALEAKYADLTKEDIESLELENSLVKADK